VTPNLAQATPKANELPKAPPPKPPAPKPAAPAKPPA